MRRICYAVAMSLDGYIAGPNGEYDWIPVDPEIDFAALYARFDTVLMGRKSYEVALSYGDAGAMPGVNTVMVSRTLNPADHPNITVVREDVEGRVAALKAGSGKDIWLYGGGSLFRVLREAGLVDSVEVGVVPVLLGGGIPMLPAPTRSTMLKYVGSRVYPLTGTASLEYEIDHGRPVGGG